MPKPLRDKMISPDSEIAHYYPDTFKLNLYFHVQLWETEPILPMIDDVLIETIVNHILKFGISWGGCLRSSDVIKLVCIKLLLKSNTPRQIKIITFLIFRRERWFLILLCPLSLWVHFP